MLKHLIGLEISPLRSALIFSYIGGLLLIVIGLSFALPSTWVIFRDDFPGVEFCWALASVGILRILFTYLFARGIKKFYYLIILGSIIKVIELPLAGFNESAGFAIWYLILTGIPEILLLINIFNPKAREEFKS
ncbi:MAG: hypothetical protein CL780_04140 [Chloroflexi bacterium]|nr:hypothetical protein [Chloroflexota bacterium]